ncbi:MAG: hypothetical protein KME31_27945, partial [Tolypothrix carrinoi HA7290-LM1]|nr:hypothetical protein [Tolypothrix carrinoi HA7290-LM1]
MKLDGPKQPDLEAIRSRVLSRWRVAKGPEKKERIALALDAFIAELAASTPESKPASRAPDGTAAPLVDEATKKLESKHYTKAEYYDELRQITERCGYRLFIDTATLGRNRELFIVNPPSNSTERIISTQ